MAVAGAETCRTLAGGTDTTAPVDGDQGATCPLLHPRSRDHGSTTATSIENSSVPPSVDASRLERVLFEIKRVIVGQDRLVERMLVALLARGHVLLEGVPRGAKTLAVETLARAVGGTFARLQFTPDLVPADIIGTRIYKAGQDAFDTELGPVFANFVLTDEINRAPAKVQSALLEVMAERQVSIGGVT